MRLYMMATVLAALCIANTSALRASENFEAFAHIIKISTSDEAVLNYIEKASGQFIFSEDELMYLADLGVSDLIIASALRHGISATPISNADVSNTTQESVQGTPSITPVSIAIDDAVADVTVPAEGDLNITYFYKALAPYGNWLDVGGDTVWQPEEVKAVPGWRPYCNQGHWVSTDRGWAWQSEYAWGWAAFHYGRWSKHSQYGYIWTPGTTWAPAWVNWRESDRHIGWAPLPPDAQYEEGVGLLIDGEATLEFGLHESDYCFILFTHMCACPLQFLLSSVEVSLCFQHTSCIKHNYSEKNKCVVNKGPSEDKVSTSTGQPVKNYKLTDAQMNPGDKLQGTKLVDNQFTAYRPDVKNVAPRTSTAVIAEQGPVLTKKYSGVTPVQRAAEPVIHTSSQSVSTSGKQQMREADIKRILQQREQTREGQKGTDSKTSGSVLSSMSEEARAQKIREADAKREARRVTTDARIPSSISNAIDQITGKQPVIKQTDSKIGQLPIVQDVKQTVTKIISQPSKSTPTVPPVQTTRNPQNQPSIPAIDLIKKKR